MFFQQNNYHNSLNNIKAYHLSCFFCFVKIAYKKISTSLKIRNAEKIKQNLRNRTILVQVPFFAMLFLPRSCIYNFFIYTFCSYFLWVLKIHNFWFFLLQHCALVVLIRLSLWRNNRLFLKKCKNFDSAYFWFWIQKYKLSAHVSRDKIWIVLIPLTLRPCFSQNHKNGEKWGMKLYCMCFSRGWNRFCR